MCSNRNLHKKKSSISATNYEYRTKIFFVKHIIAIVVNKIFANAAMV